MNRVQQLLGNAGLRKSLALVFLWVGLSSFLNAALPTNASMWLGLSLILLSVILDPS